MRPLDLITTSALARSSRGRGKAWIVATLAWMAALPFSPTDAPAQCEPCAQGEICFWSGAAGEPPPKPPIGAFLDWAPGDASYLDDATYTNNRYEVPHQGSPNEMNDTITSVWNRSSRMLVLYEHSSHDGDFFCIGPNHPSIDLRSIDGGHWNNRFSSHKLMTEPLPSWMYEQCNQH